MLRIIAGERRGHKIEGPQRDDRTRPTSDLVRESIFNILGSAVEGRRVIDLFAGTGALGLEALSRGASRALFIEKRRENAARITRNLAHLRYEDRGCVVVANAYNWAPVFSAPDSAPMVVLLDPPYRDYEGRGARRMLAMLDDLRSRLPVGSLIVAEAGRVQARDVLPDPDRWDVRRYGDTLVAVYEVPPPESERTESTDS